MNTSVCPSSVVSAKNQRTGKAKQQFGAQRAKCRRSVNLRCRAEAEEQDKPPPGCSRFTVELKKPLGIVLVEKKDGNIVVEEVVEEGAAAKSGLVSPGDQLIATSAVVYNSEKDYGGVSVKSGEEEIRLAVRGESFDTVMAAISSVPSPRMVRLEFQKCI